MSPAVVVRRPFDPAPALASLVAHAVPGVESVEGSTVRRARPARRRGRAWSRRPSSADRIDVSASAGHPAELVALADRWFGLADDLDAVHAAFEDDPCSARSCAARPGLRILGHPDGFEAAATTVLGQQVSLAAARTFGGRLAAAYGQPGPGGLTRYPSPEELAARGPGGAAGRRADHPLARADPARPRAGVRRRTHPGSRRARTCGHACSPCPGSVRGRPTTSRCACSATATRCPSATWSCDGRSPSASAAEVARAAEPWRPLRAYAAVHLWAATAYGL